MPWTRWAHVMWSTRGQWLPGDARGFRDHGHRVHSSGDYRDPPPADEHAGLLRCSVEISEGAIAIPRGLRACVAEALAEKLDAIGAPARVLCVAPTHVHVLFRCGTRDAHTLAGRAKQFASHRVRDEMPGRIWGQRSHVVRVKNEDHYRAVVGYIRNHASKGASVWEHPRVMKP